MVDQLKKDLQKLADPQKAKLLAKFFKTGKGQYGEGDVFMGVMVPQQREVAKKYRDLRLSELKALLSSKIHEHRLTALFILVGQYKGGDEKLKGEIVNLYLRNTKNINNWDLVDLSAPNILGEWFFEKEKRVLYKMARSTYLWEKRIAVLATLGFIKRNSFEDSLKISEILLTDKHDLIHKAVGWMLREIGERDLEAEVKFLDKYFNVMPRTMLRYAIEKFNEKKRCYYLAKPIKNLQT